MAQQSSGLPLILNRGSRDCCDEFFLRRRPSPLWHGRVESATRTSSHPALILSEVILVKLGVLAELHPSKKQNLVANPFSTQDLQVFLLT